MGNPWLEHIKATQKANPGMSYGEAMGAAKKTYKSSGPSKPKANKKAPKKKAAKTKKVGKTGKSKKSRKSVKNPWFNHVKAFRKANPKMKFDQVLKEAKKTYKK